MRVSLRDADAAQSRVFLPANKPASKHRANVQGVCSQIVDQSLRSVIIQMELFRLRGDLKDRYFVVYSTFKNIINTQSLLLKETCINALAIIVRIHGKSHGSYVVYSFTFSCNERKECYKIEYIEKIYLFIFLLHGKWNEKSP